MDQAPQAPSDADAAWREAFEVPPDELDAPGMWSDPNFSLSKSASIGTGKEEGHGEKRSRRLPAARLSRRCLKTKEEKKATKKSGKKKREKVGCWRCCSKKSAVASKWKGSVAASLLCLRCVLGDARFKLVACARDLVQGFPWKAKLMERKSEERIGRRARKDGCKERKNLRARTPFFFKSIDRLFLLFGPRLRCRERVLNGHGDAKCEKRSD